MRKIIPNRKVNPDKVLITQNLKVLLYYDEPYLYYGQTKKGTLVIGAAVDEDEEQGINRHTRIRVSYNKLVDFLNRRVTLYDLFVKNRNKIFVVDILYNNGKIRNVVYQCDINGLPQSYIPDLVSFCPKSIEEIIDESRAYGKFMDKVCKMSYSQINKLPREQKKEAYSILKSHKNYKYRITIMRSKIKER